MWLESIAAWFGRPRCEWRLYHGSDVMACFIVGGAGTAAEIRFEYRGELYHRFVHQTRGDAEREAQEKRDQLTGVGWSDRPTRDRVFSEYMSPSSLRRS